MSALFLLILVSLAVALVFLAAYLFAVKRGQYEDDYTPSVRILFEDTPTQKQKSTSSEKNEREHREI